MSCKRGWARLRSDLSLTVQDQAAVRAYQGLNWVSKSSAINKMGVTSDLGQDPIRLRPSGASNRLRSARRGSSGIRQAWS